MRCYEWMMESGVKVTLGGGSEFVHSGNASAIITKGTVCAAYPEPLPFKLTIEQGKSGLTDDSDFDRACKIHTDNESATQKLLQDPQLRSMIRNLVKSMVRIVKIDESSVYAQFFKIQEYKDGVGKIIALAEEISNQEELLKSQRG